MLIRPPEASEESAPPEILIIKEIILRDLRRAHEARMTAIEERLSCLEEECRAKFRALQSRIDSLASASQSSQKQALSEISKAIADIASRLRIERGAGKDVG